MVRAKKNPLGDAAMRRPGTTAAVTGVAAAVLGWANFQDWRASAASFAAAAPLAYLAWRRGGFFERRYRSATQDS